MHPIPPSAQSDIAERVVLPSSGPSRVFRAPISAPIQVTVYSIAPHLDEARQAHQTCPTALRPIPVMITMSPPRTIRTPSQREWACVKDQIELLYVDQGWTLKAVIAHLQRDRTCSFIDQHVTLRMFKSRIKTWGFDKKKIREDDWRWMLAEWTRRQALKERKDTYFSINRTGSERKTKSIKDIRQYIRRRKADPATFLAAAPVSTRPEDIEPFTPAVTPAPGLENDQYCVQAEYATPESTESLPTSPTSDASCERTSIQWSPHRRLDSASTDASENAIRNRSRDPPLPTCPAYTLGGWPSWQQLPSPTITSPSCSSAGSSTPESLQQSLTYSANWFAQQSIKPENNFYEDEKHVRLHRLLAKSNRVALGQKDTIINHPLSQGDYAATYVQVDANHLPFFESNGRSTDFKGLTSEYHPSLTRMKESPSTAGFPKLSVAQGQTLQSPGLQMSLSQSNGIKAEAGMGISQKHPEAPFMTARRLDNDEKLASEWASHYFLACIFASQGDRHLVDCSIQKARRTFQAMLRGEHGLQRRPENRFLLTSLILMSTILFMHNQDRLLKCFLDDSSQAVSRHYPDLYVVYRYVGVQVDDEESTTHEGQVDFWGEKLEEVYHRIGMIWGSDSPNALVSLYYWGWELWRRKDYAGAIKHLTHCLENSTKIFDRYHIITINCQASLARVEADRGHFQEAIVLLSNAIRNCDNAMSKDNPFRLDLLLRLGLLHRKIGNVVSAEEILKRVVKGRIRSLGLGNGRTWNAIDELGTLLNEQGKYDVEGQMLADMERLHEEEKRFIAQADFY